MISRLYVHNYRCLENCDLALRDLRSVLLIGRNGAGKSTIGSALRVLQQIARGTSRVGELLQPRDLSLGRTEAPMRFEIEVVLADKVYAYTLALEYPPGFRELRVREERLLVEGDPIFSRELAQVKLNRSGTMAEATFAIDWHVIALPIVQDSSSADSLSVFRSWLASSLLLRPIPTLIEGTSAEGSLRPDVNASNIGTWFSGIVSEFPSAYIRISDYLTSVMPDFVELKNPVIAAQTHSLSLVFARDGQRFELQLEELSDGEKCFLITALVIAANDAYGPLLCFWDEPDNFLSPSEVGASILALRHAFDKSGQLIVTSHNPEAVRRFSDENTFLLYRNSHLEPTIRASVEDLRRRSSFVGSLADALVRGDVEV